MRIADPSTPAVVLRGGLGGLAVTRSLGALGVSVHGVDPDPDAPGLLSRWCRSRLLLDCDPDRPEPALGRLLAFGRALGRRAVLIATSDETARFVAENADALAERFRFPRNDPALVAGLVSKRGMHALARRCGVPAPETRFPRSAADVEDAIPHLAFPLMLKAIDGARLFARTGKKMVVVRDADELRRSYRALEDPAEPNLMLQELVPGGDDEVYIFNGYFGGSGRCLAGFTGHKLRQFPVHVGCASLGVCTAVPEVAALTEGFMAALGYRGVLDIGYRLDPRDGRYKVLDVNPRVGQAFRLFTARNDLDVVRCLYLDLTGQEIPACVPREGRRWLIEDMDLVSSLAYRREGTLTLGAWLRSFAGVEETAWFHARDWRPFLAMGRRLARRAWRRWRGAGAGLSSPRAARASRNGTRRPGTPRPRLPVR